MQLRKINKLNRHPSVDNNKEIYTVEVQISHPFTEILILDTLFQMVDVEYDQATSQLRFDLSTFPSLLADKFQMHVEENDIFVVFFDRENLDYNGALDFLFSSLLPDKSEMIKSWLRKSKILPEEEGVDVDLTVLDFIREKLTDQENDELKGAFLVAEALNPIQGAAEPCVMTIHAKSGIDYDDVKPSDLYIKCIEGSLPYPFVLIEEGEAFSVLSSQYSMDLPYPSQSLFTRFEFSELERKRYKQLYEAFNMLNLNYFEIEDAEHSKLGGHWEEEDDLFPEDERWAQFLKLSSYSHTCDFFEDIGDCHISFFINKESHLDKLDYKVLIWYT